MDRSGTIFLRNKKAVVDRMNPSWDATSTRVDPRYDLSFYIHQSTNQEGGKYLR